MTSRSPNQPSKGGHHQPVQAPPAHDDKKVKQAAESREVMGRHKNDGQKGHKGAR
ncbi:hypothetical protein ACMYR3_01060 [Ampullimonas aquatilis]|uniref:hypothetical protein n=1 Tax=Ampullimonas aquatilis TaxID=1341549 RepID=UPI003C77CCD4